MALSLFGSLAARADKVSPPTSPRTGLPSLSKSGVILSSGKTTSNKSGSLQSMQALQSLVHQLGDPDYRKRIAAERALREKGLAVIPALEKALGHPNSEVRRRVLKLLPALKLAAIVGPKRITLEIKDKTPQEICQLLAKQTGYKIIYAGSNSTRYSFRFKDKTFWEVIDHLGRNTGLVVQNNSNVTEVRLSQQNRSPRHISHQGAFRLVANSLQLYRTVHLSGSSASRQQSLTLHFTVCVEPKTPMLGLGTPQVTAAYDSEGQPMVKPELSVPNPTGLTRWSSRYGSNYARLQLQTSLALLMGTEKARSIKVLRGKVPVKLLTEQKPVTITENLLSSAGKKKSVGEVTFAIERVTHKGGMSEVKFRVTRQARGSDYSWTSTLSQRIHVEDARGNQHIRYGTSWGSSSPNSVQLTYRYRKPSGNKVGPPARLIFNQWKTTLHVVPFTFRNIPLP